MNLEATFKGFWAAIVFGAGVHVGWAVIGAIIDFVASHMR